MQPSTEWWWPNWQGQRCAIVASGPSTKAVKLELLRERVRVIAIKENFDLCPWADVVYGCDAPWWNNRRGLPEFKGLKISFSAQLPDVHTISVDKDSNRILMDRAGHVGAGGNSGFQALNLAAQWGVVGVILIGFDCHERSGVHWYGRATGPGRNNPSEMFNFPRWRQAFHSQAPVLQSLGIEVVNASPYSALTCFPKMTLERALARQ